MEKIVNDIIKEELYFETLENGLRVYFMPKRGFVKKYAILATDFGSNDLEFVPKGECNRIRVHEGIAHFLEHKMFEQPDGGNAFDLFSKYGASANAFTNFNMTAYLFSATENFNECLTHLIDYVQTPYYTEENVEKEKGIIAQEIKMYDDDPSWQVYFNALKAMYQKHNVRIDIAGDVDSIYKITPDELYKCYNTFYNPSNMILFVIGDLDENEVMDVIKKANHSDIDKIEGKIQRFPNEEPKEIAQKEIVEKYQVSMPMFNIAYKDEDVNLRGKELLKKEVVSDILCDMIFKTGSELNEDMYMKGMVNDSFYGGFYSEVEYAFTLISGEGKDPHKVKDTITEYLERYKKEGLSRVGFERAKKKKIGEFLKYMDSMEFIANNFISYAFKDVNILDYLEVLKEVEFEDVENRLRTHFKEENCVISIVEPIEAEEN
ncbi:EF-P 5-aminopentanol modification-associated protein YfmH [Peptacetobacter sp. AB845]|uniref:EF-P 5-aminopentanol modification-associated protein YfmH n=1 Tax=Peptacetobacter sp. AB845 TaxID=3388429 RepID=UPI0039C9D841